MTHFKIKNRNECLGFAREHYAFNFDLLFYSVTTLYFETFEEDGIVPCGTGFNHELHELSPCLNATGRQGMIRVYLWQSWQEMS